jgi:hypothetical protein
MSFSSSSHSRHNALRLDRARVRALRTVDRCSAGSSTHRAGGAGVPGGTPPSCLRKLTRATTRCSRARRRHDCISCPRESSHSGRHLGRAHMGSTHGAGSAGIRERGTSGRKRVRQRERLHSLHTSRRERGHSWLSLRGCAVARAVRSCIWRAAGEQRTSFRSRNDGRSHLSSDTRTRAVDTEASAWRAGTHGTGWCGEAPHRRNGSGKEQHGLRCWRLVVAQSRVGARAPKYRRARGRPRGDRLAMKAWRHRRQFGSRAVWSADR